MSELFSDTFTVTVIDRDGQQFDNVQRIEAENPNGDSKLILDINTQIYPMRLNMVFSLVLTSQISAEAPNNNQHWHPNQLKNSIATKYEYVMYGKVYRYEEESAHHKATVYISYGGLLMSLHGEQHALSLIPGSRNVYLLMREIKS
ncbi:DNA-directed RNA polymerases I, II, and III subunit RPABC3 [Tritrichomonas foetus]|uniref:DNA-directed RNA polymerases I, II, and III subunit RPABC3 n=1 Tax=Tritrichomonas foetus TaxID=1144522 RepID=A0A1J4K2E8_9EUKA|nr:DNA-directed RNA polymerases I, II, and III subunit RPABC3 [Tritrichomonas foetus]|eukprot:OHT05567.1 DNA-directed RNA polymerases I, II, and III subunit RPABC3 [Tritrichomonas foetus]